MLKKILLGLALIVVLVLVFHSFIIGILVKPQIEKQASKMLGVEVKISVLSVRLWPGSAAVYGFKIKNPSGFSDQYLLDLGSFSIAFNTAQLLKGFTGGAAGPKSLIVDHIKIKNLKLLVERIKQAQGPISNLEKLAENLNRQAKPSDEKSSSTIEPATASLPEKRPADVAFELKHFSFSDGQVTVQDSTLGSGFEYVVDKINVDVKNIFFPAKPANELVETLDISAQLGKQSPGTVHFQGQSNLMAGGNIDAKLLVKEVAIADFNAFLSDLPFQMSAGQFDLQSSIKILSNQLESQHQLKLSSMQLKGREGDSVLLDLPMQTLVTTLNRLPSIEVPFEVIGDLKNPQFKITQALKAAVIAAIQRVIAGGLGDLQGLSKELTGVAQGLKGQALGVAGESTEKLAGDAKELIQGLTGESSETLDKGLKKLSGFLSKQKSDS